jgi:hypothetical protein
MLFQLCGSSLLSTSKYVRGIIPSVPLIDQEFIKELRDSSITKALHHRVKDVCQGSLVPGRCRVRGAVETVDAMTVGVAGMRSHSKVLLTNAWSSARKRWRWTKLLLERASTRASSQNTLARHGPHLKLAIPRVEHLNHERGARQVLLLLRPFPCHAPKDKMEDKGPPVQEHLRRGGASGCGEDGGRVEARSSDSSRASSHRASRNEGSGVFIFRMEASRRVVR